MHFANRVKADIARRGGLVDMDWCVTTHPLSHTAHGQQYSAPAGSAKGQGDKGQGAKEIGHNLAHGRPKFGHNLVRKRQTIGHSLESANDQNNTQWHT